MLLIGEQRMLRHNTMTEVDYRGTLYAASMARDLLWEGENNIDLDDFVLVSQTCALIFVPCIKLTALQPCRPFVHA